MRLHKNEWHKRYYEMFYRKRPGKRAAVDLNTATAPDLKRLMANIAVWKKQKNKFYKTKKKHLQNMPIQYFTYFFDDTLIP